MDANVLEKRAELLGLNPDPLSNLPRHRRVLEFGKHFAPDIETHAGDESWFRPADLKRFANDKTWLRNFVEEELLGTGEDIVMIQESRLLRETGASLAGYASHSTPSKGIFGQGRTRSSKPDGTSECTVSYLSALVILTTANLHFLEMEEEK